jgi:hypothetical protein
MHMYGILKDLEIAHQLFEERRKPDLASWNSIMDCHAYCGST